MLVMDIKKTQIIMISKTEGQKLLSCQRLQFTLNGGMYFPYQMRSQAASKNFPHITANSKTLRPNGRKWTPEKNSRKPLCVLMCKSVFSDFGWFTSIKVSYF